MEPYGQPEGGAVSLGEASLRTRATRRETHIGRLRRWPIGAAAWSLLWIVATLAVFRYSAIAAASMAGLFFALQAASLWPTLFMIAIFAAMPYQQSVVGGFANVNVSVSDLVAGVLALALPSITMRKGRFLAGPALMPLLFFLLIATIGTLVNWQGWSSLVSLSRMAVVTLGALLIFANAETRLKTLYRCVDAYLLAASILAVIALFTFLGSGIKASMYTLGLHKNHLGPVFGCGIVMSLGIILTSHHSRARRIWLLGNCALSALGILLSLSRGGWFATSAGVLLLLYLTRNIRAFAAVLAVSVPVLAILWMTLPEESREYATEVTGRAKTVQTRIASIEEVLEIYRQSPLIGSGVGLRKSIEPHNVLVLTLGESGLLGLGGFLAMVWGGITTFRRALRRCVDEQRKTLLIVGLAVFVLTLCHGLMDVYWRRGVGFLGWAFVGMAAAFLHQSRSRPVGRDISGKLAPQVGP
ncbi:MAG: hypothetical protein KatS3mg024_1498 [Armatimonadota bacterium]|nr:MAG: hypothetical protein KatS3mg024_1498 [Armatimonadota bacterium]